MREPDQAFIFNRGKYFVRYSDVESLCMPKKIAEDYANLFGGKVQRHPFYLTLWQRFTRIFVKGY